ncbi:MAG: hypothetical protein EOO16_08100 [Chitinophagaceae bacterium]|nr:MAG: hypothetical protein EOO16_08100 [Chitinophagaceae bacterium]
MFVTIVLEGDQFAPKALASKSNGLVKIVAEKGKIAHLGRNKGKPSPFSLATIYVEEEDYQSLNFGIEAAMDFLTKNSSLLNGVDSIYFDSNVDEDGILKLITLENRKKLAELLEVIKTQTSTISIVPLSGSIVGVGVNSVTVPVKYELHIKAVSDAIGRFNAADFLSNLDDRQKRKLEYLWQYKIDENSFHNLGVSNVGLIKSLVAYFIGYLETDDLTSIPPFNRTIQLDKTKLETK